MQYVDTHCHLQDPRLAGFLPEVLARARRLGIKKFVCCGSAENDWETVLSLANRETGIVPMLGLHPWYVGDALPNWDNRLMDLLKGSSAGLGECGLDYAVSGASHAAQIAALETQWLMALELNRPLSLHCRKAFDALFGIAEKLGLPEAGAVIHAFSGSAELAKAATLHGFYISFACSLMNPSNKRGRKALLAVQSDRLLLETDSPDIQPVPGILNEPANLAKLAGIAADLRGESLEALKKQLWKNADSVFPVP